MTKLSSSHLATIAAISIQCCCAFQTPLSLRLRSAGQRGAATFGAERDRSLSNAVRVARRSSPVCNLATPPKGAEKLLLSTDRTKSIPWKESVAGSQYKLLYMPFLDYMLQFMRKNLVLEDTPLEEALAYQRSHGPKKEAVIESWQFSSKEFRKIRLTYIDAGEQAQVFNSVWYPRHNYDAPIFGIDFLAFGKNRVLAILDLQPLKQDADYFSKYIDPLIPLRNKYEKLAGRMSGKFYDETRFFSKQLLFGKFDNDGPVMSDLYPAMIEYIDHYLTMIRGLTPSADPTFIAEVLQLQKDYDQYSAEKDPAVGLFTTYFGPDWAERFTHEFLFDYSTPPTPERREELKRERAAQMERQRAQAAAGAGAAAGAAGGRPPAPAAAAAAGAAASAYARNKKPWDV